MSRARVVLAAGLVALAGWSFRSAFADGTLVLLLVIVVPAVIAAAWGCVAVTGRALGAGGSLLAVAFVVGAVTVITRPGAEVLSGPSRLLTGVLPADPDPPALTAVGVLVGLAALVAVRFAVRPGRPLLPLLPALACLLLGLGLGAAVSALPWWYVPAFALLAIALIQDWTRVRLIPAVAVTVAACLAGSLAGQWTPRPAASVQALTDAQVQSRQHVNPMDQYLALRDGLVPLEITGTATDKVDRVAMVTLTEFDSDGWTAAANYRRAGVRLPADRPGREVTFDLRVETPDTVGWLPRPGRPAGIDVAGLGFDAATGDLAVPAGSPTPTRYRVTGIDEQVDARLLHADAPAVAGTALPVRLPPEVLGFVNRATSGQSSELGRFSALYQAFGNPLFGYDNSKKAPGGDGIYQILELLKTYRGTSEQYASAFAVMCRHLGWDARVVLGFRPEWTGGEMKIRGRGVFAWTEVRFANLGWVPIDPSPTQAAPGDPAEQQVAQRPKDSFPELPPVTHDAPPEPVESTVDGSVAPGSGGRPAVLAVLAVLLVALSLVLAAKAIRRRLDRTRGPARRRVVRAWRDVVLTLRAAGHDVDTRSTTGQVRTRVGAALGRSGAALADLVDRTVFAADPIGDVEAAFAWQCADSVRVEALRITPRWRRVRSALDPRPLLPGRRQPEYA